MKKTVKHNEKRLTFKPTDAVQAICHALIIFLTIMLLSVVVYAAGEEGNNATLQNYDVDNILNTFAVEDYSYHPVLGLTNSVGRFEKEVAQMAYHQFELPKFDPPAAVNPNETTTMGSGVATAVAESLATAVNGDEPTTDLGR